MNKYVLRTRAIKKFFSVIDGKTALYFWNQYPSPEYLGNKTAKELAEELLPISHNVYSIKRTESILSLIKADGTTKRDYQESRDTITRSLVGDLWYYREQLEKVENVVAELLPVFECTLTTMPGVGIITAAQLLSEIGNINRFPNVIVHFYTEGIRKIVFKKKHKIYI